MGEKKQLTKTEKRVITIMTIAAVVAAAIFAVLIYINDYYEATEKAKKAILGEKGIVVEETEGYYYFTTNPQLSISMPREKGIIFYPGGKVDEVAYAPLMVEFARAGYDLYVVKMPAKLAIFGANAAA